MEHCVEGADEWRGSGGPMTVANVKRPSTVAKAFVEACERLQYQRNADFNGDRVDGVGFAPLNVHNGWRRSTAVGYLRPNLARKNLESRSYVRFAFRTHSGDTLNEAVMKPLKSATMALQWLFTGTGQLAVGATEATLFAKSSPTEPVPDLQYQVLNFSSDSLQLGLHRWPGFTFIFSVCRPKSRGAITLRDPACRTPPRILANYLTDTDDMRIMLAGFRIGRQIAATEPFASLVTEQIRPDPAIESDDEIADFVRGKSSTVYHPCGTCRMGEDEGAVVDSHLRLRGIDGLRVVDASVMPAMPSPNIHPATIMAAEKGSDIIAGSLAH
jgi:choline dehydrogenase